jgi:hypothetical protein
MLLFRSLLVAATVCGAVGVLHAPASLAVTRCENRICEWTPPLGTDIAVRLTVGTDESGVLRWVATQNGLHFTAEMETNARWIFTGSNKDDVMVEVLQTNTKIKHGDYTLAFPTGISQGMNFRTMAGNDIAIGGARTQNIVAHEFIDSRGLVEQVAIPHDTGKKVYISHPDTQPLEKSMSRSIRAGGVGANVLIAGPPLVALTDDRWALTLWGGVDGWSNMYGSDLLCNMSSQPVFGAGGFQKNRDYTSGPGLPPETNPAAAEFCASAWLNALIVAYSP